MKTLVAVAFIIFISSAMAVVQPPSQGLGHVPKRPGHGVFHDQDSKVIERFVSSNMSGSFGQAIVRILGGVVEAK